MRFLNVLPWALSASSLLLPPSMVADSDGTRRLMPIEFQETPAVVTKSERITLQCDGGCPTYEVLKNENGISWHKNKKNHESKLVADIKVDRRTVFFNGQQIFPATGPAAILSIMQSAGEQPFGTSESKHDLVPMSTFLDYKPKVAFTDGQFMTIIHPIVLEIQAVVDTVVHAESVEIRIVESGPGFALLPSKIQPYQSSPLIDSCTTVWCRMRGVIAQKSHEFSVALAKKLHSWRGCGGKMRPHAAGGVMLKGGPKKFGPGSSLRPHHHHAHHHHGGRFTNFLRRVVRAMIPPFIGLSIGLAVGSIIKLLVLRLQRRRALAHGEYTPVEQSSDEEARTSIDGLPKYEDVYGEIESEKVDEKKEATQ